MANFVAGSLNVTPVFYFSSFKRDFFLMYPLAVLLCRIDGLDLPASWVIMGMRRAKAGVSTRRRSPPCKHQANMYRYAGHVVSAIEKSHLDQVLSGERPSAR